MVAFLVFLLVLSALPEQRDQTRRDRVLRSELATAQAPVGGRIAEGRPVAILTIPALDIRQVVAEGTTARTTMGGAGHVRATPLPGQAGNSVVMARRSTFGAPFRHLGSLRRGDRVRVVTGQGRFTYRVTGVRTVPAGDRGLFATTSRAGRLSLVTGDPALRPSRYLVADASLEGHVAASGPHARRIVAAETGLVGQGGGLLPLALGLLLLGALGAATTWLLMTWRPWSTYLVATPAILAGVWWVCVLAAPRLPALL
jgi:sortase A